MEINSKILTRARMSVAINSRTWMAWVNNFTSRMVVWRVINSPRWRSLPTTKWPLPKMATWTEVLNKTSMDSRSKRASQLLMQPR